MNRVLINSSSIKENLYSISDTRVREHIVNHLKLKIGDTFKATLLEKGTGLAIIKEIKETEITVEMKTLDSPELPEIHLCVATSRPPTLKKIIEHGTSLGVTHFHFFKGELSDKSYSMSKVLEPTSMASLASLGLEQGAKNYKLPQFENLDSFDKLSLPETSNCFILSLEDRKLLSEQRIDINAPVILLIGSERGWTKKEENTFRERGFIPVFLSEHVLRTEIATFSALSQLEMIRLAR